MAQRRELPEKILIVRPTALGDVARTVPALVSLRRAFPGARIDWLVAEAFTDVVRHHPGLNGVVGFPRKRFGRIWRDWGALWEFCGWAWGLRRAGYDWAIDFQGLLRSGIFSSISGARQRIGYANAREGAWVAYNRRYFVGTGLHAVERVLELLAAHGVATVADMRLYVGAEDRQWARQWIGREVGTGGYACVAPTAKWKSKCWPIERYTELVKRLLSSGVAGEHVVVLAGPGEMEAVAPLLGCVGHTGRVHHPTTTVGQMMAMIEGARLVVCNDSAPLHIAVGLERPLVAVFGPTDPRLVGPWGRNDSVICPAQSGGGTVGSHYRHLRDSQELIGLVTVEQVWEKVLIELKRLPT